MRRPYVKRLLRTEIYDALIQADAPILPLKNKSIDISLACEILEHLNKDTGYKLLKELERISRKTIVISTPLNWPQAEIHGNPYERHISEWRPQELTCLGYNVKIIDIMHFLRRLRGLSEVVRWLTKIPPAQLIIAHKRL